MYCKKCGRPNPDNGNFCLNCGTPLIKKNNNYVDKSKLPPTPTSFKQEIKDSSKKGSKIMTALFVVSLCVFLAFLFFNLNNNKLQSVRSTTQKNAISSTTINTTNTTTATTATTATTETTTEKQTVSDKEYKASCKTISYKDIARQPNKYYDEKVVYTGQVFQVSQKQDDGLYYALVYVTQNEYGYYDDTMYICYELEENEPKFLEDDIVTFYGECKGEISYESVLGNEITVPAVYAKYIELVK